ncbi:vitamin B12 import ATP-binding protein BtuD [Microbulbifer aestuariivivens]|uniref:Vitamin B12 import ATP-binding protein BtuD n=1 Tax=Microbulbifer aestuariivivens TaxID=1908308 RepID=A0ABP9WQK6_9GAMM
MSGLNAKPADASLLSLKHFGVAFGDKTVLSDISLEIADRGITVLLGPSGTGKSTLLRTLAGFNDANPRLGTWGSARYLGQPLGEDSRPALTMQNARLMMASILDNLIAELPERSTLSLQQQRELACRLLEGAGLGELVSRIHEPVIQLDLAQQRHLAILRLVAPGPRLLLLDEPTTGLDEHAAELLLHYIAAEGRRRAIFIALHNQAQARRLGGKSILIAGGVIQEAGDTHTVLGRPTSAAAKSFVRTGSCSVASPGAPPETLAPDSLPPAPVPIEKARYVSDSFGPRGFLWLIKGKLAGTPRPGIVQDIAYDLKALNRVGVTTLITLTKTPPETESMAEFGIRNIWAPIPDMQAPPIPLAIELCEKIDALCAGDDVVAVHCKAGLGRTGTILAAYRIWQGHSALEALENVRHIEPRWVQSECQVDFLEKFASFLDEARSNLFISSKSNNRSTSCPT